MITQARGKRRPLACPSPLNSHLYHSGKASVPLDSSAGPLILMHFDTDGAHN